MFKSRWSCLSSVSTASLQAGFFRSSLCVPGAEGFLVEVLGVSSLWFRGCSWLTLGAHDLTAGEMSACQLRGRIRSGGLCWPLVGRFSFCREKTESDGARARYEEMRTGDRSAITGSRRVN